MFAGVYFTPSGLKVSGICFYNNYIPLGLNTNGDMEEV